jgi:hypothetical protein
MLDYLADEAERSAKFHGKIERLRVLGNAPHLTGPLTSYEPEDLERLEREGARRPEDRARSWGADERRVFGESTKGGRHGNRHVRDYVHGCRAVAREFFRWPDLWPRIHWLVCGTGYRVNVMDVPLASAPAAPSGPVASTVAAHISGANWGHGATANRQNFYNHTPTSNDYRRAYKQAMEKWGRAQTSSE